MVAIPPGMMAIDRDDDAAAALPSLSWPENWESCRRRSRTAPRTAST